MATSMACAVGRRGRGRRSCAARPPRWRAWRRSGAVGASAMQELLALARRVASRHAGAGEEFLHSERVRAGVRGWGRRAGRAAVGGEPGRRKPTMPSHRRSWARDALALHRRLDQAVGPVGRVEDLVRVVEPEGAEVHGEVVLVRHREADLGDLGVPLEHAAAHVEEGRLEGRGVLLGERLQEQGRTLAYAAS